MIPASNGNQAESTNGQGAATMDSTKFRSCCVVATASLVIGIIVGAVAANHHELRVWWGSYRLRSAIENYSPRPDGKWDMTLEEPLAALNRLIQLGAEREACQVLVQFVDHPNINHRLSAYVLLGDLGEFAIPAIPRLSRVVQDASESEFARKNAASTIDLIREVVSQRMVPPTAPDSDVPDQRLPSRD